MAFLRNFFPLTTLYDPDIARINFYATIKAVELLLLGELSVAIDIFRLVDVIPEDPSTVPRPTDEAKILAIAIKAAIASGIEFPATHDAKELLPLLPNVSDKAFDQLAKDRLTDLPDWELDEQSLQELLALDVRTEFADASTGYAAIRISAALAAAYIVADALGKIAEMEKVMERMSSRIHANSQARYLAYIRCAWSYYLQGGLRKRLGLDEEAVRVYGEFVRDTLAERKERGARSSEAFFDGKSDRELLELCSRNTLTNEEGRQLVKEWREEMLIDHEREGEDTILLDAATDEQLQQVENDLEITIPQHMKDIYEISNGTEPMLLGAGPPVVVTQFLGSLEDWKIQLPDSGDDEECHPLILIDPVDGGMRVSFFSGDLYEFKGLEWGDMHRCVAVNGCTQEFNNGGMWLVSKDDVIDAKRRLDEWLQGEGRTEIEKQRLERLIHDYYGSRQRFDAIAMSDEEWAGLLWSAAESPNTRFWPDARALLCWLAMETELTKEDDRSPMAAPQES